MLQGSPCILTGLHIRFNTTDEPDDVRLIIRRAAGHWSESNRPIVCIGRTHLDNASVQTRTLWNIRPAPPSPFLSVQNELRSVYRPTMPSCTVIPLPLGKFRFSPRIPPAEVIPVIHMKRHGHKLAPEPGRIGQSAQPLFRRRTTAAPFRSVQLQQRGLWRGALELNRNLGRDGRKKRRHGQSKGDDAALAHITTSSCVDSSEWTRGGAATRLFRTRRL